MKKSLLVLAAAAMAVTCSAIPAKEARIDIRKQGTEPGQLVTVDKGTFAITPAPWFNTKTSVGVRCQTPITPEWQEKVFKLKAVGDGKLTFCLMGPDVRDKAGQKLPHNVEYTLFEVNGKTLLDKPVTVWHNKQRYCDYTVKNGEEVTVKVKFRSAAE